MRILGVDPGTRNLGIGIIETERTILKTLHFETVALDIKKTVHFRLKQVYDVISKTCDKYQPDSVSLEDIYHGMSFRSAVRIGEARAAVILAATQRQIPVTEYPPAKVKNAVAGFGRARKEQMQFMVRSILKLDSTPPPDAADALALAICHSNKKSREVLNNQ